MPPKTPDLATVNLTVTIILKPVLCGTEINIVQEGIPDVIPPEMCHLDWQESLSLLVLLVEPNIPVE